MIRRILRERVRARALKDLAIAETPAEPGFDRFTDMAAEAFAAPIALLSLVRDDHIWIKARTGVDLQCLPREHSFCTHAVDRVGILEVCDASVDPTYRDLPPVVGEPFVRYYFGAPIRLDSGTDVGVLCILDTVPRVPASRDQRAYMIGLARQAAVALERNVNMRRILAA